MQYSNTKIIREFPDWNNKSFRVNKWNNQFVESNVIINTRTSDAYFPLHWTPLSIKCAFGGAEYYVTNRMKYRVDDSSFLVLNHGNQYESFIRSDKTVESFTIAFAPDFTRDIVGSNINSDNELTESEGNISGSIDSYAFFEKLYRHDEFISQLMVNIRNGIQDHSAESGLLHEQLHFLFTGLLQTNKEFIKQANSLPYAKQSTKEEIFKRLNIARDFIDSCFAEKISLGLMAKTAGLCEHHLLREFKKHFNITPHQYLTKRRLEESKILLKKTDYPVSQIAILVGFEFLSSFSKLFTKNFKISPITYRNSIS